MRAPWWRTTVVVGSVAVLVLVVAASLAWGARDIDLATVLQALRSPVAGDNDHLVVQDLRIPRTLVGLAGGAALGVAGALMQGVTRNPIADPGLLGVNAGASLLVVAAIAFLGVTDVGGYLWFAFAGAAIAAVTVYGASSLGWEGVTPVKLALVGAAFTAVATSLVTLVLLTDLRALDEFRFWQVGTLLSRPPSLVLTLVPFLLTGLVLALVASPMHRGDGRGCVADLVGVAAHRAVADLGPGGLRDRPGRGRPERPLTSSDTGSWHRRSDAAAAGSTRPAAAARWTPRRGAPSRT